MIWKREFTINSLNNRSIECLNTHLAISFIDYGDDFIRATMPVDQRTKQPYGILHGGASASLAETIGSVASLLCIPIDVNKLPVGIEISASHLKSVTEGKVTATATPIRIGRKLHVWNIDIRNDAEEMICISRLTTMIIDKK